MSLSVEIKYFAQLRDVIGTSSEAFELSNNSSTDELLSAISARHPHTAAICSTSRVALDLEFVHGAIELKTTSDIAIIPPVSGG